MERQRLREALIQDFVDDLPSPLYATRLAKVLRVRKEVVHRAIERGALTATKVDGAWVVDAAASRPYLRGAILRLSARRRHLLEELSRVTVRPTRVTLTARSVELLDVLAGGKEAEYAIAIEQALEVSAGANVIPECV
ncbi:hypothetical protein [Plantibacter sp. YIM 135249]|uniref:hypothetical protein n=1 Tax=Plantibacter sp. YIM 135249 TaxID=3423918 RepID=UPI003D347D4C